MTNLEVAKKAYQYFIEGNIEGVLSLFDSQVEWHECKGFPYIDGDGIFHGPQEVAENVFAMLPEYFDGLNIDIKELIDCDDRVIMVGYYRGIWTETGKEFKANATHVLTFKDSKMTRFFQAVDTATIINPVKVKKTV